MSRETQTEGTAKPLVGPLFSYYQSIRVGVLAIFFALSITMMAHKHGRNRLTPSLQTQSSFGMATESSMRKLLSEAADLDEDVHSIIGISVKESRPVNDPEVIEVEKFLRESFNEERRLNCASLKVHKEHGHIQFVKRSMGKEGVVQYDLEVVFGEETVFASMQAKPSFQIVSSVPAPCDDGVKDEIAVSLGGMSINEFQGYKCASFCTREHIVH
jgi:hypothetical protein